MDNVKIEDLVDSDIEFIEKDSGMSSLGGSKDETPERRAESVAQELEEKPSTSSSSTAAVTSAEKQEENSKATINAAAAGVTTAATINSTAAPTAKTTTTVATKDATDNYDDEPDETLAERLLGLSEMFPDCVRNFTGSLVDHTNSTIKILYKFSCNASWVFFTSSIILFAPVIFETERAQMEEMQKTQQKQVLLGPGSAMAAAGPPAPPTMPSMR